MARKKASLRLPKLRHHQPTNQGCVELSGKIYYLGKYGTDRCETAYQNKIAAWLANGKKPLQVATATTENTSRGLTVIEIVERYLDHANNYYIANGKPTSGAQRVKIAARVILLHFSTTPAIDFGPLKLRAVQQLLVESKRGRRYVNALVYTIKRMFEWAASMELCPASIFHSLKTVPGLRIGRSEAPEPKLVRPVAETALLATLPHLGPVVRDMVQVQRRGGMRPAEVCTMRPADVDRTGEIWIYKPVIHKLSHLGRERIIPIGPKAQEILMRYMDRPASQYCFSPTESLTLHLAERKAKRRTPASCGNTVGSNRKMKPRRKPQDSYTTMTYGKAISRACQKAFPAVKDATPEEKKKWHREHRWKPNQLRHLAATELRAMGSAEDSQSYLGHASLSTTEIYAERNLTKLIELARIYG